MEDDAPEFMEIHEIVIQKLGHVPIVKGDFHMLSKKVQKFVAKWVSCISMYVFLVVVVSEYISACYGCQ